MNYTQIDGKFLREMFANGYRNLLCMEQAVNDLNVFPVPDGDTGSNMVQTLGGGVNAIVSPDEDASAFMKSFSRAVLLSARGNSGVILSQFIQGLAEGTMLKAKLAPEDFLPMMVQGTRSAYSAVIKPTEGTMLTVIREASESLVNHDFSDFSALFSHIVLQMKTTLKKTPELLPVLKEAGVVDSGGVGLIFIIEGMLSYLQGITIDAEAQSEVRPSAIISGFGPDSVLEFGYCTEFILQLMNAKTDIDKFSLKQMIEFLEAMGDSLVCVQDADIVKVHIHTFTPEKVLGFAREFGEFVTIKIENMSVQHSENISQAPAKKEMKKFAVVAVASGDGLSEYFSSIGADVIVDGGQTQNPSTQDFIEAFNSLNAENIIVLPNNSNIVLTARQAASMYEKASIHVVATKSMAEGYSALSMMNPDVNSVEEFVENMTAPLKYVTTGCVTRAIHDANMNSVAVKEGDYIGIANGTIVSDDADRILAAVKLLESLPDIDSKEVLTLFYGEGCSEEDAEELFDALSEKFPLLECGAIYGGQNIYDFYMAIE